MTLASPPLAPEANSRPRPSVLTPVVGVPGPWLNTFPCPVRRSARKIEPSTRDPKYAVGPGPIAMPSGCQPSGSGNVVGRSAPPADAWWAGAAVSPAAEAAGALMTSPKRASTVGSRFMGLMGHLRLVGSHGVLRHIYVDGTRQGS